MHARWKRATFPPPRTASARRSRGDIEAVDNVLRITRIRVNYALTVPRGKRAAAERAVALHPSGCPAWNTVRGVRGCIDIDIRADIKEAQ